MVSQPPFLHLGIHIGESIVYICIHHGENFVPSNVEVTLLHWTLSFLTSVLVRPITLHLRLMVSVYVLPLISSLLANPMDVIAIVSAQSTLTIVTAQFVQYFQLDCNPSQVKSNLRLVASLPLHSQWFFSSFPFSPFINHNWPSSNAYISAKSLPIWIKLWIPHLMTNHNKVYDAIPNLNHSKSQLISTQLNA